ncbi:hypothetical protein GLOIN_2v1761429 [Rhizophagus irregularis DAOM 181602=DAOM 197198]|nr:hypothetical protein GLOIN_2v1761429 [Rhizophagus irregularis DAOM 181602=DAOM 197198]
MYQHKKDLDNDNAASLVDKVVIAEEKVVDVIKKHRMGVEEELDEDMVTRSSRDGEDMELCNLRVIEAAESHDVIQRYTTLNNDLTKRVKEKN